MQIYEQMHEAFREYLLDKFEANEADVSLTIQNMEEEMPSLLNEYFGVKYDSIYDLTDSIEIEGYRKKIKAHPVLNNLDMSRDPRYTDSLKWYRLFIKALNRDGLPVMVPGEITSTEPEAESGTQHKVVSTVFMEGEAAEAQPTEIRRRNKELRDACISYFRTLHEGRIVCECCGFDFAKRYDIDNDYIEVHHRFPFSQTEGEHPVDAVTDLVPLCANCHRMIHFGQGGGENCMSLEDLKKKLR
jgi:predicted HNH restriction endonuclease